MALQYCAIRNDRCSLRSGRSCCSAIILFVFLPACTVWSLFSLPGSNILIPGSGRRAGRIRSGGVRGKRSRLSFHVFCALVGSLMLHRAKPCRDVPVPVGAGHPGMGAGMPGTLSRDKNHPSARTPPDSRNPWHRHLHNSRIVAPVSDSLAVVCPSSPMT